MSKITTADCCKWLATNAKIQELVADRSGHSDYLSGAEPLSEVLMTWVTNGKNPKKWKRQTKYKIGSKTDKDGYDYEDPFFAANLKLPSLVGGVVRDFWLEDTDHITIAVLEKDDILYFLDDLSD